eukprot:6211940-Pleurochrysis_carterae.AAC.2
MRSRDSVRVRRDDYTIHENEKIGFDHLHKVLRIDISMKMHQEWDLVVDASRQIMKREAEYSNCHRLTAVRQPNNDYCKKRKLNRVVPTVQALQKKVAEQIRVERLRKRLSISELAQQIAVDTDLLRKYEQGQAFPDSENLRKLSAFLNITFVRT